MRTDMHNSASQKSCQTRSRIIQTVHRNALAERKVASIPWQRSMEQKFSQARLAARMVKNHQPTTKKHCASASALLVFVALLIFLLWIFCLVVLSCWWFCCTGGFVAFGGFGCVGCFVALVILLGWRFCGAGYLVAM